MTSQMMADTRSISDPRPPCDPRSGLVDARGVLSVCTCGMPNCTRLPHHHPAGHGGIGIASEGHLAAAHGLPAGLPLGGAPIGHVDPAVLYQMGAAYGFSESPDVMRSLPQLGGYYPYDPSAVYPYMNGYAGIDARRKNATKESTNTLKAWLFEHRKNPYPTKGEKIMLAILTKMTLTQVSTWFANARRRLKKENKVTWVTKDDDVDDDDEDDDANSDHVTSGGGGGGGGGDDVSLRHHGSVGEDDDSMSVMSAGERSEVDVEEHSDEESDASHRITGVFLASSAHDARSSLPAAQAPADQSGDRDRETETVKSARSDHYAKMAACHTKCDRSPSDIAPITPPPSPKDARTSQSTCSSHPSSAHVHQSTATIHHHPVTSASTRSSSSSSSSAAAVHTSSSPSKPKIWSIADVVSSKDDARPEVTSSRPSAFGHSSGFGAPSAIVSLGGAPVRAGGVPQGLVVPGPEVPYSLAYYSYGLPHAAVMMASQAAPHMRLPHPYSLQGRSHHLVSPAASALEHPLLGQSGYVRAGPQLAPSGVPNGDAQRPDHIRTPENNNKPAQGQVDPKCTTSVFMPVVQRQV